MHNILKGIKEFFTEPKWEKVRAVFWFCLITLIIHISWRFWVIYMDYFPIRRGMFTISEFFVNQLFDQSFWLIKNIFKIKIQSVSNAIYCDNGSGVSVVESCSGVKQILQFALLILFIPGPWKHKLWFIPIGMFIIHLTNVLRISLLVVIAKHSPSSMELAHNSWLRIMFYVVIFILWLIWIEKIAGKNKVTKVNE